EAAVEQHGQPPNFIWRGRRCYSSLLIQMTSLLGPLLQYFVRHRSPFPGAPSLPPSRPVSVFSSLPISKGKLERNISRPGQLFLPSVQTAARSRLSLAALCI